MEFPLNASTCAHRERMRELNASVQLDTGVVHPYVSICSLDILRGTSGVLRQEFLKFLQIEYDDANLLTLDGSLNLGFMSVNGVFFRGDIKDEIKIRGKALIIPPEKILLGSYAQDNTRRVVYRSGLSLSYGTICNTLGLFCPESDYPARERMREFLCAYPSIFD